MDLDLWDCYGRKKLHLISKDIWYLHVEGHFGEQTRAPHANTQLYLHLENSKSKKGHNFVKKIGGLPPLPVWVPLLIVNNYSEFQVNIFRTGNNRDIRKCQSFGMTPTTSLPLTQPTPGQYDNTSTFSLKIAELKMPLV